MFIFLKLIFNFIYKIMLFINNKIYVPLNKGTKVEIFIGISGVLIAIVIFIAENMQSSKLETQKKFVLEKTNMKNIMISTIVVLVLCILNEIIPYSQNNTIAIEIIFFLWETTLNALIIKSICLTIMLFKTSIKLITETEYYNEEYDKYIKNRLEKLHKIRVNTSNLNAQRENTEKFISENKKYFTNNSENLDEYIPIKANSYGIFRGYNCKTLQTIIDKIENKNFNDNTHIHYTKTLYTKPLFILNLKGGEKLTRSVTIAYCIESMKEYENSIRNALLYDDSAPFQDNEINIILNDSYISANDSKKVMFDQDKMLYNFYNFLYEKNMHSILNNAYDYIGKIYLSSYKVLNDNKKLSDFLSKLLMLAYYNEDYEHYQLVHRYIYFLYKKQLDLSDNIRDVSYDYTETLFRYDYYSVKNNEDFIYYDVLLSNLLNFIFDLIEKKEFESINDLFQNVMFEHNVIIDDEPNQFDILRMQFSFGFIYGLIILENKHFFDENDKQSLKNVIRNIKNYFVEVDDQIKIMYYFKKYFHKTSNIQYVYSNFDLKFENHKYRNSFTIDGIGDIYIIKEYIYVFGIQSISNIKIEEKDVSKEDKYHYKSLLKIVESEKPTELEQLLDINFDNKMLVENINGIIKIADLKEKEFNRENKIDQNSFKELKTTIYDNIKKGNELTIYLKENNKFAISNDQGKKYIGFNQLVDRSLFFYNLYPVKELANRYSMEILSAITKSYLKNLDNISEIKNEPIEEYIGKLRNCEKYVIITSPLNYNINSDEKNITINNKKIDLISILYAKDIYLIKKEDLPEVNMLNINIDDTKNEFQENWIFYRLIDCSKDIEGLDKILRNTKWLAEKGDEKAQRDFLKEHCAIKLFVSPSIKNLKHSKCIKFVVNGKK